MQHTIPSLVISLDFELMWGVRDKHSIGSYGENVLGVREAIPAMLRLFKQYDVKATWAAVGMLLFRDKRELLKSLPQQVPGYHKAGLSPYSLDYLNQLGIDENSDPYHFGLSLAEQIVACPGMELGSHTFCHYYCLEKGQNAEQFRADLQAAVAATRRLAPNPISIVFPRNQVRTDYLAVCAEMGFRAFRGNEASWIYRESADEDQGLFQRGSRLLDSYVNLSGDNGLVPSLQLGLVNVPSSRFLRPHNPALRWLEPLRVHRIVKAMSLAILAGRSFHLWWHPHNFGIQLRENLAALESILAHFGRLRERHGMQSMTMGEMAANSARNFP